MAVVDNSSTDRRRLEAAEKVQMLQFKRVLLVHVGRLAVQLVLGTSLGVDQVATSGQLHLLQSRQPRFLHHQYTATTIRLACIVFVCLFRNSSSIDASVS